MEGSRSSGEQRLVKAIISVRVFKPEILRVGKVILQAYVPVEDRSRIEEVSLKTRRDDIEALLSKVYKIKRELNMKEEALVEIEVEGKGFALHVGERKGEKDKAALLFPRPARLLKIGLMKEGKIRWYRVPRDKEYYVYEGYIEVPEDVQVIILETDAGTRVVHKSALLGMKTGEMAKTSRG